MVQEKSSQIKFLQDQMENIKMQQESEKQRSTSSNNKSLALMNDLNSAISQK